MGNIKVRGLVWGLLLVFLLSLGAISAEAKPKLKARQKVKVQAELQNEGEEKELQVQEQESQESSVKEKVYGEKKGKKEKKPKKIEFNGVVESVYGDSITVVKGGLGYQEKQTFTLTSSTKIILKGHLKKEYSEPREALKPGVKVKLKANDKGEVKRLYVLPSKKGEVLKDILVVVNGQEVDFPDVQPFIENNRTLIPIRFVAQALGLKVDYKDGLVIISNAKAGRTVIFVIGSSKFSVNGEEKQMEVPAQEKEGRTFIPVRYLGESLDKEVNWVEEGIVELEDKA